MVIVSVPIVSYVVYAIGHGYTTLEHLADNRDPMQIRTLVRSARGDFERANFLIAPISWLPLLRSMQPSGNRWRTRTHSWTRYSDAVAPRKAMNASGAIVKKDTQDILSYRAASRDVFSLSHWNLESNRLDKRKPSTTRKIPRPTHPRWRDI